MTIPKSGVFILSLTSKGDVQLCRELLQKMATPHQKRFLYPIQSEKNVQYAKEKYHIRRQRAIRVMGLKTVTRKRMIFYIVKIAAFG